jgi:hypothetical protein
MSGVVGMSADLGIFAFAFPPALVQQGLNQ